MRETGDTPTDRQLRYMRQMAELHRLAADETTIIRADPDAAEQCVDRGWLEAPYLASPYKYPLTALGWEALDREAHKNIVLEQNDR